MTIDEAIQHCIEVADNKEQAVYDLIAFGYSNTIERDECQQCAADHRQIAEWLKDYKRLLAIEQGIDIRCGNCKHDGSDDGICEECFDYRRWEEM